MKLLPGIIARLSRFTDAWSRSITGRNSGEFTWPPQAPVEAFDFKTGQIVSLSHGLERGRDPYTSAPAPVRRAVPWRPGKLVKPVVATLGALALVVAAYQSVRFAREFLKSGKPGSPQTSATAAAESSNTTLPAASPVASDSSTAPAVAVRPAVVKRGEVENGRDRDRQLAPRAPREQSARTATSSDLGWFSLSLPIQAQIFENDIFVGTSDGSRVMLPPGMHRLELVNESLRYREWRSVEIKSGRATPLNVVLPAGRLQVNAIPWGEVLIDGKRVGETPLGDLRLPIGGHRIVFRHPELGEQTRTAMIVAGASTRISVNFNQ